MELDTVRIENLAKEFSKDGSGVHIALGTFLATVESLLSQMESEDKYSGTRLTQTVSYTMAEEVLEAYRKVFE